MSDQTFSFFADASAAQNRLHDLKMRYGDAFARCSDQLLAALASAADPDRALVYFERLAEAYGPTLFAELEQHPRTIESLVTLFSASQFLSEILLRNPTSLALFHTRRALTERKTIDRLQAEAEETIRAASTYSEKIDALRRYQQLELLRVGASDLLDLYDLRTVFSQLSRMAIGLTRAALTLACEQTGLSAEGFVVIALGKLGGYELNYSSDIDLVFVARQDARDRTLLAEKLIEILSLPTGAGFLYRVDTRLRPWGQSGPLVSTVEGVLRYLDEHARLWEKQALLKFRPIAGDLPLGESLRHDVETRIHRVSAEQVRAEIFAMKQRTEEFLRQKGREWGEVKLGAGSIRDIEFVVQALQMTRPQIRTRVTLKAIPRLREEGLLTPAEAAVLTEGYVFLRTVEHYLQIMDYRQTYSLPSEPAAIALLARRLGFEGAQAGENFIARYEQHRQAIRAIFLRKLGQEPAVECSSTDKQQVDKHLARMDASYGESFLPEEIRHHAALAAQLTTERQAVVEAIPIEGGRWRVTIVAYDYPGELSLICGLLFVYGMNILDGLVFTYEPEEPEGEQGLSGADRAERKIGKRKIVDVFTVKPVRPFSPNLWDQYTKELIALLQMMRAGRRREARGELAKRVGAAFHAIASEETPLLPVEIEIDNETSPHYTVLRIDAPDTIGFLYEFTNALAFYRIYIARVIVRSVGQRVQDVLYVTDSEGRKITDTQRQRELRAAIVLIKHFTHLLPRSPNPETALLHFREFIFHLFQRPNWPDELASVERPEVLSALARVLGVSDFLWEDFLRMQYAALFPVVRDVEALRTAKSRDQLEAELKRLLASPDIDWRASLNAFKDRELFRIDMRHILGMTAEFWDFAAELTELAEVVIQEALAQCQAELRSQYGDPRQEDGAVCPLVICALGKFGGRELGFASDIELMFLYDGVGTTDGSKRIPSGEYFEHLVETILKAIQTRQDGIFHIDLQLRPYGKHGSLAVALEAFRRYYAPDGPAWAYERQALVKLRPIVGDETLARQICELRDQYVYHSGPFDVVAMRAMRERQMRHLVSGGTFNAKFSPGGLADLEYLVQGLQINHGAEHPEVRTTNTRAALDALHRVGVLSESDYTRLRKAHTFFRWLIDALRVVRGNASDVTLPPADSEAFAFLARRLLYGNDTARLQEDIRRYASDVQEISARLLG